MRRLIESTIVSLDGVIGSPERWAGFDAEATELAMRELAHYDAFVMGRVTYENFYANWGQVSGSPYIDLINAMPKYVASRSLTETAWNATVLGADPPSVIARMQLADLGQCRPAGRGLGARGAPASGESIGASLNVAVAGSLVLYRLAGFL